MLASRFLAEEDVQNDKLIQKLLQSGYSRTNITYSTRRPDQLTLSLLNCAGEPVIGKLYSSNRGKIAFGNMLELWNSTFGRRGTMPRPIEYLDDPGVLIMEYLPGRPLIELGKMEPEILKNAMALLADLHASDAKPVQKRAVREIVRSLKRKGRNLRNSAPEFSDMFDEIVELLERFTHRDFSLVPGHGDFSPRNILVDGNHLALIDWDRFQWADPARDVVYIGVWCWTWLLREGQDPEWSVMNQTADMYDQLRPEALIRERLPFHIVAGLLRIAHSLVEFWPADRHLVPQILIEARKHLL
jgi:Phosphotransferase enzyme family